MWSQCLSVASFLSSSDQEVVVWRNCPIPDLAPCRQRCSQHNCCYLILNYGLQVGDSWLKKKQPSALVRQLSERKEKAKAKRRYLLPRKAHGRNEKKPLISLRLRKVVPGTSFQPSKNSNTQRTKGTHSKKKEHPHSEEGTKMFKQTTYSSDQAFYSRETKLGLTNSLSSKPTSPAQLPLSFIDLTSSLIFANSSYMFVLSLASFLNPASFFLLSRPS